MEEEGDQLRRTVSGSGRWRRLEGPDDDHEDERTRGGQRWEVKIDPIKLEIVGIFFFFFSLW